MTAPHGRSWTHYLVGLLLNAMAFVALGPAVGYFAFAMVCSVLTPIIHLGLYGLPLIPHSLMLFAITAPLGLCAAYWLGTLPAAATAVLVGAASSWMNTRALRISGPLLGALTSAAMAVRLSLNVPFAVAFSIAGAAAAAVMVEVTRGLRLAPVPSDQKGEPRHE